MKYTPPPRVLFVSYLFPPVGGVGVHRVTKFVKYLPRHGWQSSILTVANPSVPLQDESLLNDIPAGTIIRRARTFEPGYAVKQAVSGGSDSKSSGAQQRSMSRWVKSAARRMANAILQPDPQVLWHPCALRAGLRLLRDVRHDAIIASGPPFSSFLLGARLARRSGLPLILDYRDEWDISNAYWENKQHGRWANWVQSRQQRRVVRAADVLLATTPASTAAVAAIGAQAGSRAEPAMIYNGFDPDDYVHQSIPTANSARKSERFRLAFIGTLWNLNSIEPVVRALQKLSTEAPHLAGEIELLLAGRRTEAQEALLDQLQTTPVQVTRLPFVSHPEAVSLMRSADALLMLNSDVPHAQRIVNAKTFEYMAARRPMFVVAPEGDVWQLVRDLPGTVLCRPADIDGIAEQLALAVERQRCGIHHDADQWDISRFERPALAGELAQLLNQVVSRSAASAERSEGQPDGVQLSL